VDKRRPFIALEPHVLGGQMCMWEVSDAQTHWKFELVEVYCAHALWYVYLRQRPTKCVQRLPSGTETTRCACRQALSWPQSVSSGCWATGRTAATAALPCREARRLAARPSSRRG
jgi:hypothetical protein